MQSENTDSSIIKDEILVDLQTDFDSQLLEIKFEKYQLLKIKDVSKSLNIILYQFDANKISVDKLIKKISKIDGIESVQTNKKITKRR
tara:strand:+ start:72 stop:335 length:264 start_codon:yes stop_codon:yes gene_type:complete